MAGKLPSLYLALFVCLQSVPCLAEATAGVASATEPTPRELYHSAWKLVNEGYYDPTYNQQKWTRWEHRYDKQLKTMDDADKAIETMLASLGDRYTRFLNKEAFKEEKDQIAAHLFGIGIQMGLDKSQRIIVIAPIEGMPAAAAGILPMDEIAEINGKDTKGMSVEAASKLIRGEIDTEVTLTIMRNNKERKTFVVKRAEIPIRSVTDAQMLTSEIGYIRMSTFMSERATGEMREALAKLTPALGIIIDLRNNPGGLVTNALGISSLFLAGDNLRTTMRNIIVSTVDRNNNVQTARASGHPISNQLLVLLINQGSASASEITSGALHDAQRAELVGTRSFGKGLVQSITRLQDGSGVNMTIARYLTPNNIDIHKKGITPDYIVTLSDADVKAGKGPWWIYPPDAPGSKPGVRRSPGDKGDVQLNKAIEVLSAELRRKPTRIEVELGSNQSGAPGTELGGAEKQPAAESPLKYEIKIPTPPTPMGSPEYELKLQDIPKPKGPGIY